MLIAPAIAVLPLVLKVSLALGNRLPFAGAVLAHGVLSPSSELELPDTILNPREQRHDRGDRVNLCQELEKPLIHEDSASDADSAMADVFICADDPVGGECETAGRHGLEAGNTDDHDDRLEIRRDLCPVVAVDIHLGVDVKGNIGESVRLERGTRFPHRNSVQNVETPGAQVREVMRTNVMNDRLNLIDGTAVLRLEKAIEAGVLVHELGI